MKLLSIVFWVSLITRCAAAEFSKGETIELTQDAPLVFNGTTAVRVGKKGERFKVIVDRPQEHRVYVSARDPRGQEIALSIAENAVVAVQSLPEVPTPKTVIPAVLAQRFGATARTKAMAAAGGKAASEKAVMRGLQWLVENQNADGSWGVSGGRPVTAAMTGFSLLSLLGHGETPDSPEFGATIKKAVDWLIVNAVRNEARLSMEPAFSQSGVYAHGIVTLSLCEYYTITGDERVVDVVKKAVGYIVDGQGPDGGWSYAYDKSESDTSVGGWQIQALKAAQLSGMNINGVDGALAKAMLNLKRVQGNKGGFGYRNAGQEKYSLTGVGLFCMYLLMPERNLSVRNAINYMMAKTGKEYPVDYKGEYADLYVWFYNTQAFACIGGQTWQKWNQLIQDELLRNQSADGSWPAMTGKTASGDFQRSTNVPGPVYRTTLCVLILEAYYRYGRITN